MEKIKDKIKRINEACEKAQNNFMAPDEIKLVLADVLGTIINDIEKLKKAVNDG